MFKRKASGGVRCEIGQQRRVRSRTPEMLSIYFASLFALALGVSPAMAQTDVPDSLTPIDRIAQIPCRSLTPEGVSAQGWRQGNSTFGVAYIEWGAAEFSALKRRARECDVGGRGDAFDVVNRIEAFQKSTGGRIEALRREAQMGADGKRKAMAELASIAGEQSGEVQLRRLESLRRVGLGALSREDRREILDEISLKQDAAREKQSRDAARREEEAPLLAAEAEVKAQRDAVANADAAALLREQRSKQAAAGQADLERRTVEDQDAATARAARFQALAEEKKVLDARRAEQMQAESRDRAKAEGEAFALRQQEAAAVQAARQKQQDDAEAELMKRPECRDAVIARREELPKLENKPRNQGLMDQMTVNLAVGNRAEGCAMARELYTSMERLRSTAARCEPASAFPYNQMVQSIRNVQAEYGCR